MILGIDLGTTNSLIAVWESSTAKIIPNILGKALTPSIISIDNDEILIGEPALNRMVTHPSLTVANFKRYMGSDKTFTIGKYTFRPEELSALVLKRLKEDAENYLGHGITEAVISVPAYFSDAQRKATKTAAKLAGLKVERLINEPTAAGIAYGIQENADETNFLIFDLGGGTFDVSILNMFSGVIEVRATSGDNFLGGIDFTKLIETAFIEQIKSQGHYSNEVIPLMLHQKIYEQAELTKHRLSIASETNMRVNWESQIFEHKINHVHFEKLSDQLLKRIQDQVKKVLNDAKLSPSKIDQVVLVGGASQMPIVKKLVGRMFGRLPLCHLDPDTVIAKGAAIQGGFKANNQELDEFVVTDVCPYSLGIAVYNQTNVNNNGVLHFDPIIERNTTIPTSRSRTYHPIHESQRNISIQIYQGEHFYTEQNIFLGQLSIELPIGLKDRTVDIRFTYDINGLLEVEATINETKDKKNIVIEGNPGVLNEKQITDRLQELKELKIHPREKTANKLILTIAERLYQDLQNTDRVHLAKEMTEFIHIVEMQNEVHIAKARKQLEILLNDFQTRLNLF